MAAVLRCLGTPKVLTRSSCLCKHGLNLTQSVSTMKFVNFSSLAALPHFSSQIEKASYTTHSIISKKIDELLHDFRALFVLPVASAQSNIENEAIERDEEPHGKNDQEKNEDQPDKQASKKEPSQKKSLWKTLKKIMSFMAPDSFLFILAALCSIGASTAMLVSPAVFGSLANAIGKASTKELLLISWKVGKVLLVQVAFRFGYTFFLSIATERMSMRLHQATFSSLLHQPIAYFDREQSAQMVSYLNNDIRDVRDTVKKTISSALQSTSKIVGATISLFSISGKLTSLMLFVLPPMVTIGTTLSFLLRDLWNEQKKYQAIASGIAGEALGNIRTVRAFEGEEIEEKRYMQSMDVASAAMKHASTCTGIFFASVELGAFGLMVGLLCAGGSLVHSGVLTTGDITSFMLYTNTLQNAAVQLSTFSHTLFKGASSANRLFEIIERGTQRDHLDKGSKKKLAPKRVHGTLRFENIRFSYPTRPQNQVLNDINFTVRAGERVGIVGPSGSGKTTLVWLLERFYDLEDGVILLDGNPLSDLDVHWLRGQISIVSQEPVLFSGSILDNVRYGQPDATQEEVEQACQLANAHNFITKFSQGYNTQLGERGIQLSGGQKQRIAIARALLRDPQILILDEATSALDSHSEAKVQEALERLMEGRTVLVIAHRLSTIRSMDKIVVLQQGKVVEQGSHDDLATRQGVYANLLSAQMLK